MDPQKNCLRSLWKFKQSEIDRWVETVGGDREGGRDG